MTAASNRISALVIPTNEELMTPAIRAAGFPMKEGHHVPLVLQAQPRNLKSKVKVPDIIATQTATG